MVEAEEREQGHLRLRMVLGVGVERRPQQLVRGESLLLEHVLEPLFYANAHHGRLLHLDRRYCLLVCVFCCLSLEIFVSELGLQLLPLLGDVVG